MAEWVGFMVSIDCGERGCFQGEIINATSSAISLRKVFCDGVPYENGEVTLSVKDIADLKLIEKQTKSTQSSTITIAKPIAKKAAGRSHTVSESSALNKNVIVNNQTKSKPIDIEVKNNGQTPNKNIKKDKVKYNKGWRDEACFGSPLDSTIDKEFDFEKNLALFDKQAVFDEINSQRPDLVKNTEQARRGKYRHDENVIQGGPTLYRQIVVPKKECQEYVTDEGLIVPSITENLRKELFLTAEKMGLTWERQNELMGRAAVEISLQLLGGGHRLNPKNLHQLPTVVILTNSTRTGAVGVNTARQLSSHGINTVLFTTNPTLECYKLELSLYRHTKNKFVNAVSALPPIADLIIVAVREEPFEQFKALSKLLEWTNNNRAPVLTLDPSPNGIPGLVTKFSLVPVLPMANAMENGKIYLCNLGFPLQAFIDVGIKYHSPFGSKFIIPLHPTDD